MIFQEVIKMQLVQPQRRKTETKPDTYSKDRIFVTPFAFCVITYEPIEVQTFSAPQNDRQNLVFVKDIKVVVEKMTRNRHKVIGKPGVSLLCRLHSIQLSSLVYSFLYAKIFKIQHIFRHSTTCLNVMSQTLIKNKYYPRPKLC